MQCVFQSTAEVHHCPIEVVRVNRIRQAEEG
jgi:hypothetical protein